MSEWDFRRVGEEWPSPPDTIIGGVRHASVCQVVGDRAGGGVAFAVHEFQSLEGLAQCRKPAQVIGREDEHATVAPILLGQGNLVVVGGVSVQQSLSGTG